MMRDFSFAIRDAKAIVSWARMVLPAAAPLEPTVESLPDMPTQRVSEPLLRHT